MTLTELKIIAERIDPNRRWISKAPECLRTERGDYPFWAIMWDYSLGLLELHIDEDFHMEVSFEDIEDATRKARAMVAAASGYRFAMKLLRTGQ